MLSHMFCLIFIQILFIECHSVWCQIDALCTLASNDIAVLRNLISLHNIFYVHLSYFFADLAMFFTSTTTTNPMKNCDMYKPVSNCRMIFQRVSVCLEAVSIAIVSHSYVIQCAIISNNIHMCPNDIFLASRAALWMSLLLNFSPTFSHPSASVNSMNISVQYVFPNCLFSLFYSLFLFAFTLHIV